MKRLLLALSALFTAMVALPAVAQPIADPANAGLPVIVSSGSDDVIATYLGTSASYTSELYLVQPGGDVFLFNNQTSAVGTTVNLGSFAAGTELVFRLNVLNTGDDFFSGAASRNPDGFAHAAVQGDYLVPGTTLVSFEDLFNGPFNFNDLSFSFSGTVPGPQVPEPATWGLMILGFGAVGAAMRRRSTAVAYA